MCDSSSDPTTYDRPATCEGRYWQAGRDNRCTRSVAVTRWSDSTGTPHAGCPMHVAGLQLRYPAFLIEEWPGHGKLALSTPWARDLFGPNDQRAVENAIPSRWTIDVAVSGDRRLVILRLIDPTKATRAHWRDRPRRYAVSTAMEFARLAQTMDVEGPVPDVLTESVDPITQAKAEADRFDAEPWTVNEDGTASQTLSYMRKLVAR